MNGEIFVLNLATKVTKRLTFNGAVDHSPTWSAEGTKLAFASYRTGKMQIWTRTALPVGVSRGSPAGPTARQRRPGPDRVFHCHGRFSYG
jgi:Tol biopolymer transport system component